MRPSGASKMTTATRNYIAEIDQLLLEASQHFDSDVDKQASSVDDLDIDRLLFGASQMFESGEVESASNSKGKKRSRYPIRVGYHLKDCQA